MGNHGTASVMPACIVVPAWSAGTQIYMDVCGGVPAGLDAGSRMTNTEKPSSDVARYDKHVGFGFPMAAQAHNGKPITSGVAAL